MIFPSLLYHGVALKRKSESGQKNGDSPASQTHMEENEIHEMEDGSSGRYIPDNVFEDLNIKAFFNLFFQEEVTDKILEVIRRPPQADDIIFRQEVFKELEKPDVAEFFNNLKSCLYDISRYNRVYEETNDIRYKQAYYIWLLQSYINFIKTVADPNILNASHSKLLNDFIISFHEIMNDSSFSPMEKELLQIEEILENTQNINIDIYRKDTYSYFISESSEPLIIDKLKDISEEFGFDITRKKRQSALELSSTFIDSLEKLFPETYKLLADFYKKYGDFYRIDVLEYDREISFYLNLKKVFDEIKSREIPLCYPVLSQTKKIEIYNAYDVTLFLKESNIIPNDMEFTQDEGFFILTGANGGGKTTYIRTLGVCQIMFLSGGCIPATSASIYPFDAIYTHFTAEEGFDNVSRLIDEEQRAKEILKKADDKSLVLLNETFSSTSVEISVAKSLDLVEKLCSLGSFGVLVTHQYKVAELAPKIDAGTKVGNLSTVVLNDSNNTRTFRIVKKLPENKSYAFDILYKYGLTKGQLAKRFRRWD